MALYRRHISMEDCKNTWNLIPLYSIKSIVPFYTNDDDIPIIFMDVSQRHYFLSNISANHIQRVFLKHTPSKRFMRAMRTPDYENQMPTISYI